MKAALIYSKSSKNTSTVANIIKDTLKNQIQEVNIDDCSFDEIMEYDLIIAGVSTWYDGELPPAWDEYLPGIEEFDMQRKSFAIFGLGNQKAYPENYQDAMGILEHFFVQRGAKPIGKISTEGYNFEQSLALRENSLFCGLSIDSSFTEEQTKNMIHKWLEDILQGSE